MNSDGCRLTTPSDSQRRAPLTVGRCRESSTSTSSSDADDEEPRREPLPGLAPAPGTRSARRRGRRRRTSRGAAGNTTADSRCARSPRPSRSTPNRPSPGRAPAAAAPPRRATRRRPASRGARAAPRRSPTAAAATAVSASRLRMRGSRARVRATAPRSARRARRSRGTVEARAGGRQQHRVAGLRERDRARDRALRACRRDLDRARRRRPARARSRGASRPISSTARQCAIDGGLERREVLALAVAAGDQHDRPVEALERGLRRADRRALGVVDEQHAAARRRSCCIRCGRPSKRASASSTGASILRDRDGERERRERVERVVAADERQRRRRQRAARRRARARCAVARCTRPQSSSASRHAGAERLHRAARQRASRSDRDRRGSAPARRAGEDARLGRARSRRCRRSGRDGCRVRLSTAAAIGFEARRGLELVARQLEHEHVGPRRAALDVASSASSTGVADVAGDDASTGPPRARSAPVSAVDRRLAVGAGDRRAPSAPGGSARAKSSMSPTRSAPCATRRAIAGWSLATARADRDQVDAGERRCGERRRARPARRAAPRRALAASGGAARVSATRTLRAVRARASARATAR